MAPKIRANKAWGFSLQNPIHQVADLSVRRQEILGVGALPIDVVVLHEKARVKLARLHAAESLMDLATLPGSRLEALKGDRKGQYSIRVNDQYWLCFRWEGEDAYDVEVTDYH